MRKFGKIKKKLLLKRKKEGYHKREREGRKERS